MQKQDKKIYAFIDSQNLNLAIKAMGWELDFARFRVYLKDKYGVRKAFLFIGYIPGNESLYTYLQKSGYILVFKPVLETKKGIIKGNVDAELVLHTMIEISNYDKAMIVSGDGDFHCLIKYLITVNKFAYLLIPNPKRFSSLLREFRGYFVYIHKLKQKLRQNKKRRSDLRTKP